MSSVNQKKSVPQKTVNKKKRNIIIAVVVIVIAGIIMALVGTVIIFVTVTKSDCKNEASLYESN